ncbi:hypothetical protein [Geminicoccus flavidas]|uniref:hypothetical protein n=1 Tax=Geminicoccus flavidas TaxID=2506407 RepID=UPI00135A2DC3|nr:hypothetical protein [Geminicoccus flavidas]
MDNQDQPIVLPKEQIYDAQISPLMTQIIGICKEHGIAMIASFALGEHPENGDLQCTTMLPDEAGKPGPSHLPAVKILREGMVGFAMSIVSKQEA